jgi:hypothetical protein
MKQFPGSMIHKLGGGDKTMSLSEDVRPLLAARASTDPNAARLLEIFTKADEILSECSIEGSGISKCLAPSFQTGRDRGVAS